jgi:hypothetical protein
MKNQNLYTPAFPTYPIQDKLGQLIFHSGISALEYGAFHIAAGLFSQNTNLLPETIAELSVELAESVINHVKEKFEEDSKKTTPTIQLK